MCLGCWQQTRWKFSIGQAQARSQYGLVRRTYGLFFTNTKTNIVIVKMILVGQKRTSMKPDISRFTLSYYVVRCTCSGTMYLIWTHLCMRIMCAPTTARNRYFPFGFCLALSKFSDRITIDRLNNLNSEFIYAGKFHYYGYESVQYSLPCFVCVSFCVPLGKKTCDKPLSLCQQSHKLYCIIFRATNICIFI